LYHPEFADAAKQYGEQECAYRQLYKELDDKRRAGKIDMWMWCREHNTLDNMHKDLRRAYSFVDRAINTITFAKENNYVGEIDKGLAKIYLENAFPGEDPFMFCIMQD
jgi:hypothetical protein